MSKGVNFTQKSADRISDVVREVEGRPFPETVSDRRRAGGLGRSTLWEVTAVQTGPGTVTIKRVSNIDFDLNDPSEKEDILYDPDNAPSVGDRGLLIRLGEGPLFFFRRPVGINRRFIDAIAYVKQSAPDINFGYPTVAKCRAETDGVGASDTWYAIFHFTSPPPLLADAVPSGITGLENVHFPQGDGSFWRSTNPSASNRFAMAPFAIRQSFDPSTITYNSYLALTKQGMQQMRALDDPAPSGTINFIGNIMSTSLENTHTGPDFIDRLFKDSPSYGIALQTIIAPTGLNSYAEANFKLRNVEDRWYNGWVEWPGT